MAQIKFLLQTVILYMCEKIYEVDAGSDVCVGGRSAGAGELVLVRVVVELVSVAMALVLVAMEMFRMCSPGTIAIPRVLRLRSGGQDSTCSTKQVAVHHGHGSAVIT